MSAPFKTELSIDQRLMLATFLDWLENHKGVVILEPTSRLLDHFNRSEHYIELVEG